MIGSSLSRSLLNLTADVHQLVPKLHGNLCPIAKMRFDLVEPFLHKMVPTLIFTIRLLEVNTFISKHHKQSLRKPIEWKRIVDKWWLLSTVVIAYGIRIVHPHLQPDVKSALYRGLGINSVSRQRQIISLIARARGVEIPEDSVDEDEM